MARGFGRVVLGVIRAVRGVVRAVRGVLRHLYIHTYKRTHNDYAEETIHCGCAAGKQRIR